MALPTYTFNSIPDDVAFNAFLRPTFDKDEAQEEFPGHLHRLRDDALSNDTTQIKPRFVKFENELKVTASTGLTVTVTSGTAVLLNGTRTAITATSIAVPNGAVSYVYIDESAAVATSTAIPLKGLLLARVTTVSGAITTVEDLRPRYLVQPLFSAVKIFGGSGDQGDYVLSTGTATFDLGQYYFKNFTVAVGTTLTVLGGVEIYCSGNVSIQGTITVSPLIVGGGASNTSFLDNTFGGGATGSGPGAGSGFTGGSTYSYVLAPHGSGGAQGRIAAGSGTVGRTQGFFAAGGKGGGCLKIEAAGTISVSGTINCRGGNGGTPTLDIFSSDSRASGAGGGSGGLILLKSLSSITCTNTSTLDVRGGNGGNGTSVALGGVGGGSGGGGYVVLIAPTDRGGVNTTGASILLSAGTVGNSTATGTPSGFLAGTGGGGFGGQGGDSGLSGAVGRLVVRNFQSVA